MWCLYIKKHVNVHTQAKRTIVHISGAHKRTLKLDYWTSDKQQTNISLLQPADSESKQDSRTKYVLVIKLNIFCCLDLQWTQILSAAFTNDSKNKFFCSAVHLWFPAEKRLVSVCLVCSLLFTCWCCCVFFLGEAWGVEGSPTLKNETKYLQQGAYY